MNPDNLSSHMYDKDFRKKVIENPKSVFDYINQDIEVKVVKNSKNIFYIAVDSQSQIDDYQLNNMNAAGTNGTVSSVFCAATAGSVCSTASTGGTASSAGTVGST